MSCSTFSAEGNNEIILMSTVPLPGISHAHISKMREENPDLEDADINFFIFEKFQNSFQTLLGCLLKALANKDFKEDRAYINEVYYSAGRSYETQITVDVKNIFNSMKISFMSFIVPEREEAGIIISIPFNIRDILWERHQKSEFDAVKQEIYRLRDMGKMKEVFALLSDAEKEEVTKQIAQDRGVSLDEVKTQISKGFISEDFARIAVEVKEKAMNELVKKGPDKNFAQDRKSILFEIANNAVMDINRIAQVSYKKTFAERLAEMEEDGHPFSIGGKRKEASLAYSMKVAFDYLKQEGIA